MLSGMWPVTLTRPAFSVTCACASLADIACWTFGGFSWVVRDYLAKTTARTWPARPLGPGPALFLNASILPDSRYAREMEVLAKAADPFLCTSGQRVSAALVPDAAEAPASPEKLPAWLLGLKLPLMSKEIFVTLDYQFQLVKHLPTIFAANLEERLRRGSFQELRRGVYAGPGVTIADTAVLDTREGPVVLDREAHVGEFACFQGPVFVGERSRVIERATVREHTSIGPTCKIGGEIETSIIEGFTNKQHHGFLGHSWVGSWVNLGAGTSNSDLKNTYGEIRLDYNHSHVDTGMQFFGCAIGDYSKSAINTSIFTGKLIGVSSMLYGFVGQNVPSFCNYARSFGQVTECPVEQAILIQKRMFSRRNAVQQTEDVELLRVVFDMTRGERLISDEPPSW